VTVKLEFGHLSVINKLQWEQWQNKQYSKVPSCKTDTKPCKVTKYP